MINENEEKISIVIPLYKSEKFLRKLLDSVIGQTYHNLEIILVDDESPDDSGKIADEYAGEDNRVKAIHKKNAGCCEARNSGIRVATGQYLMFADGDDWLEPDCIEYLYRILKDNNCDMSMTDSIFTTRDRKQNSVDRISILSNIEAVAAIVNTFIIPVGPWNKLYSMKVIKENNISFSVPWFGEGLYFSAMAAQYSNNVAVGHKKVYNYRLNNPNSGCTKREVNNGINMLYNIKNLRRCITLSSKTIDEAFNWHVWMNNLNLIGYIATSRLMAQYNKTVTECRKESLSLLPKVLKHSRLPISKKIKGVVRTLFPVVSSVCGQKINRMRFNMDKME